MNKVIERNKVYYEKYPRDMKRPGGIDRVHQLVLRAANDLELFNKLSYRILHKIEDVQQCDSNPFYAILHEVIYCQGRAANWPYREILDNYPQFIWRSGKQDTNSPIYFTGEMIFPEMLDEYANLRPLKGVANMLAEYTGWPALYDEEKLRNNTVKITAATYFEDMYVDFARAQKTACSIGNLQQYISNQHLHSAIRKDPATILGALFTISRREMD
ncbi:Sulfhydryl oxidase [Mycena kentingensis (nom. inval.)]|nr:Sulfhydryl oxidase [Mycena kentingensis (nom. inval.)]